MSNKYSKEIKLALTALCAIIVLFYGINFLKGINLFKSYSTYYVEFKDVTGLEESNAVYANGFPVGIVRKIDYDYDHPGNIRVAIEVDNHMHFPNSCHAELKSGLLGGTTMNVVMGNSTQLLKEGDSFPGYPEVGMMDKFGNMTPQIEAILPKVDSIMTSLNLLLANPAIANTLNNTEYITANLKITTDQLNALMKNDIPVLIAKLNTIEGNASDVTAKLGEIDYAATINNVNNTISSVNNLTAAMQEKINSKEGTLGLLLNDNGLYNNLNSTMKNTDALMQDLRLHPKRYVHFSVFGKKDN